MSLPRGSFTALDSMLCRQPGEVPQAARRVTRKRPYEQLALESGVIGEEAHAPQPAPQVSMQLFRLLHLAPKVQKTMRSPAARLRGDHMAIATFPMQARHRTERWLTVAGDRHSGDSAIRLLSLKEFLQVGSEGLKDKFLRCTMSPEVQYNFHGLSLDSVCHSPSGTQLVTKFMEANAVPSGDILYLTDKLRAEVPHADEALQGFLRAGVICESGVAGAYQVSDFGIRAVRYSRRCVDFVRFFQRRNAIPIADRTHWELIDELTENGWRLQPVVLKKPPAPLSLEGDVQNLDPSLKVVHFHPHNLDLCHSYLLCLNSLEKLKSRGHL